MKCEEHIRQWRRPSISIKCPLCKLESPENAVRCACGYEFAALGAGVRVATADLQGSLYLRSIDHSLRTIKFVMAAWAVLTVIGLALLILSAKK